MSDPLSEVFQDHTYCLRELGRLRQEWSKPDFNWDEASKALIFMLVNCKEETAPAVTATLQELEIRSHYAMQAKLSLASIN